MAERPRYVVDASVAGKWYLRDEDHIGQADQLLLDYREARIVLIAPYYLRYEVPSLICKAVGGRRLTPEQAQRLITTFLRLDLRLVRTRALSQHGIEAAFRYRCTFYDGLYIALAEAAGARFVHADARLERNLAGQCPQELWIDDYGAEDTA